MQARVKLHWYRQAPRARTRWICGFWEAGGTEDNHTVLLDIPPEQTSNPAYWYMTEYDIHFSQVIISFDNFDEKNVDVTDQAGRKVKDARGKPVKTKANFFKPNIQLQVESRCRSKHAAEMGGGDHGSSAADRQGGQLIVPRFFGVERAQEQRARNAQAVMAATASAASQRGKAPTKRGGPQASRGAGVDGSAGKRRRVGSAAVP